MGEFAFAFNAIVFIPHLMLILAESTIEAHISFLQDFKKIVADEVSLALGCYRRQTE